MRYVVWLLVLLLLVLHQDYWQWGNTRLWFGFLPHALAWQLCLSVAACGVWLLAVRYCWPHAPAEDADPRHDG